MDISLSLRTAYYTALNGQIKKNLVALPVYDAYALPENIVYPYILLSSQTESQRIVKRCKMFNVSILIDIVTGSIDMIGRAESEGYAEQIDNIVNPDSFVDLTMTGYTIGNTYRGESYDTTDKNQNFYIYRKLIRYNHIISKN